MEDKTDPHHVSISRDLKLICRILERNNAHEKKLLNKFELTQQANITSKIKFPMNEIIFVVILFVAFLLSAMQLQNAQFKYFSFL